eukprot:5414510-Prymnesium_polylepis.1
MIPRMGCASNVEAYWRLRFGVSCARDSISRCIAGVAVACWMMFDGWVIQMTTLSGSYEYLPVNSS